MDVQNGLRKPFAARFLMPAGWLRGELPALLLLFAFTVAYRAYFMRFYDVMSADGTSYASAGKAFFQSFDPRVFGTVMPPLYSLFIGLCNLLTDDLEMASRLVSVIFSSLTIFPLYLMGRGFFGRIAAAAAVLLFATLPFIHGMSGIDIAEPIYTFFAFSGAYLGWRAYNRKKIWPMGGAGALLALAYLARPEGFVLLVAFTLLYAGLELMAGKWRTAGPLLCVFWLGFFIVAFPYLHQLHDTTGKWQLSGKTSINTNIIKEYRGQTEVDSRFRLDAKGQFVEQEGSLLGMMLKEPSLFLANVRNNLQAFPAAFNEAFPFYLWPFVVIGLLAYPWRDDYLRGRLFLLAFISPLLLYAIFYIVSRYLYPYLPVLLIWVGAGLARIEEWLNRSVRGRTLKVSVAVPAAALLFGYFIYLEYPRPRPPYHYSQDGGRYDDKQVGIRLRSVIPEGAVIMTRSGRVAFYVQRPWVLPPQASFAEILDYARKNKVSYLVANLQLLSMRPQLELLYTPLLEPQRQFTPPPGLELVYLGQEPGGLPYLVYRLSNR